MSDPYLVQRARFKANGAVPSQGWDAIVSHDYMGSAEFEFGALPAAMRVLVATRKSLVAVPTARKSHDGHDLVVICEKERESDAIAAVEQILCGKARLKDPALIKERLSGDRHCRDTEIWWDLQNNWIATLGMKNASRLLEAINAVAGKRGLS